MLKKSSIELAEPTLVRSFGLERVYDPTDTLNKILNVTESLKEEERKLLNEVRKMLIENVDTWNEEELKMQFISIIMYLARFQNPIRTYYDREIAADVDGHYLKAEVDMLLSKGYGDLIETPYFFLHEYKREKRYSGDPIGQMLGGMLIGQAKNNNGKPMYGCYVQGRFWFFSVLVGKQFVVSLSHDATDEVICEKIVLILRKLKNIILTELMD
jgi:hypothetical protein